MADKRPFFFGFGIIGVIVAIAVLLIVILIPMSFSYLDFYEVRVSECVICLTTADWVSIRFQVRFCPAKDDWKRGHVQSVRWWATLHRTRLWIQEILWCRTIRLLQPHSNLHQGQSRGSICFLNSPSLLISAVKNSSFTPFKVSISVELQYFLIKEDLKLLHDSYDIYYQSIIVNNAKDALKVSLAIWPSYLTGW